MGDAGRPAHGFGPQKARGRLRRPAVPRMARGGPRRNGRKGRQMDKDYKEAYEQEKYKSTYLAGRVAELEDQVDDLQFRLDRIKNNPVWKASAPFRRCMHFCIRQADRVKNCGSLSGVIDKMKYKANERKAMCHYGTESFPDEAERERQKNTVFGRMVKVSVLTPLWNTPENFLREMIESVQAQTYQNWELCLADGSDDAHAYVGEICREYAAKDPRVVYRKLEKNGGIAENTNRCLEMATGEFVAPFDHDDLLHPSVLYEYVKVINEKDADYIYCDEATFKNGDVNQMITMHFKPDYAIDNLRANNYICHFSMFDRKLLEGTELYRTKFDGSQDHDMILRLTDKAKNVVHVPKLLYYWRQHAGSVSSGVQAKPYVVESARGAVADHLRRHGFSNFKITSTRAFETIFKITYEIIGEPKISIIIPNKDHVEDLRRCITSIIEKSTYDNYEIIVVENNSETREIFAYYEELANNPAVKIIPYKGDFNYSAINNLGVSHASGDYVLLLNNDIQIITVNWMEELLMYAQRPDVGAVGAKLYYPDKTIQHAGVVIGLGAHRTAGHVHYRQKRENLGYMGRLCYAQNMSAVTGACLLVKKALYEEAGGLDESFAVSLNDVDFCLKLRKLGYLNVFTPFAEAYHYESASRGSDMTGEAAARYNDESARFREKWKEQLEAGDPYYNPNFSLDKSDFSLRV